MWAEVIVCCAFRWNCISHLLKKLDACVAIRLYTMASKWRSAKETSCGRRCSSKPTGPVVNRIVKGSAARKVRERRRSPSRCIGGKLIPASIFDDLATEAVKKAVE